MQKLSFLNLQLDMLRFSKVHKWVLIRAKTKNFMLKNQVLL